jgi:hypothetical protein
VSRAPKGLRRLLVNMGRCCLTHLLVLRPNVESTIALRFLLYCPKSTLQIVLSLLATTCSQLVKVAVTHLQLFSHFPSPTYSEQHLCIMAHTQPAAKLEREKKLKSVLSRCRLVPSAPAVLTPCSFRFNPLQTVRERPRYFSSQRPSDSDPRAAAVSIFGPDGEAGQPRQTRHRALEPLNPVATR